MARWDYHATHINQLLTLATIEEGAAATQLRYLQHTVPVPKHTVTKHTDIIIKDIVIVTEHSVTVTDRDL